MSPDETLPPVWTRAPIGSLCTLINGRAFKPTDWEESGLPIVRIQNLNNAKAAFNRYSGHVDDRHLIASGDLLFAWSGTPGTSFGAHVWRGGPAVLNQHIFRVLYDDRIVDRDFFRLAINQELRSLISKAHGGAGLAHVTKGRFEETTVALPPLPEQRRIVAAVTALFDEVEAGEAALARAREALTTFRASLLHAAVTGQLTEAWRAANPPTEDGPALLSRILAERTARPRFGMPTLAPVAPFTLPDGWTMCCLADLITDGPTNGYSPKASTDGVGTLSLKLTATTRGVMDLSPRATKQLSETLPAGSPLFLKPGDLLFQRGNTPEYVGMSAVFDGPEDTFVYPDLMIRVRTHAAFLTDWLWRVANSPWGRHYWKANASGTAGTMPKITGLTVRHLPVPLPPHTEIRAILDEIAHGLAGIEVAEMIVVRGLREARDLRQSILHAAFTGRLVPQDPADEPAAALLARLRAAPPAPRRTRRRTPEATPA